MHSPIRVLMLTNMYPSPRKVDYGTFVFEQVRALRAAGVEVDTLFVNGRASRWNYLLAFPRFWYRLARRRYDLIHAHYVFSGWIARTQPVLPVVQSFHSPGQLSTYRGPLCRMLAPRVDAVIVTTIEHRNLLGLPAASVIPCGVNLELFRPRPRREARRRVGWPEDRRVLLWLGDPRPVKRLDLAQAAYALLRARISGLDLRVVSSVPHEDVPWYMNAADLEIFTSDQEGSPVVIKEAMACNLPIVATAVGDVPELFHGVRGCALAEHTAGSLAEQAARLIASGERSDGRAAIERLSTAHEARRILDVYRRVLSRRRAHGPSAPEPAAPEASGATRRVAMLRTAAAKVPGGRTPAAL